MVADSPVTVVLCRYYIEYGSVHIVMMSTEHDFTAGSIQYQWLKTHLSHNIDRKKTPWLIFTGHRYLITQHSPTSVIQTAWDPKCSDN